MTDNHDDLLEADEDESASCLPNFNQFRMAESDQPRQTNSGTWEHEPACAHLLLNDLATFTIPDLPPCPE